MKLKEGKKWHIGLTFRRSEVQVLFRPPGFIEMQGSRGNQQFFFRPDLLVQNFLQGFGVRFRRFSEREI